MDLTRRAFIKANAAASAAAVAGITLPAMAANLIVDQDKTKISWINFCFRHKPAIEAAKEVAGYRHA